MPLNRESILASDGKEPLLSQIMIVQKLCKRGENTAQESLISFGLCPSVIRLHSVPASNVKLPLTDIRCASATGR